MHKSNKYFLSLCLLVVIHLSFRPNLWSQTVHPTHTVYLMVDGVQHPMHKLTTKTERKRGWDIQGISIGNRTIRYIMGKQARQLTSSKPTFVIYPEQLLNDYAIIRLKERHDYRMLPSTEFKNCNYQRIELDLFNIRSFGKDGFLVTPYKPLTPGEYILVDMSQKSQNAQDNFFVYDFTVEK